MYLEGGRRSRIVIPEGRKGFGWRRFADELSKVKVVLEDLMGSVAGRMESQRAAPLTKGKRWAVPSFAEVVRTVATDKKRPEMVGLTGVEIGGDSGVRGDYGGDLRELDLFPLGTLEETPAVRTAVNCYDLEMGFPVPVGEILREVISPRVRGRSCRPHSTAKISEAVEWLGKCLEHLKFEIIRASGPVE
jgi:hypothetical protein